GYDDMLFEAPDVTVWRGDIVAIIGPNGAGKSTLLKTMIGELDALSGEARQGANVQVGYFAQAHEKLNADNSILDEILNTQMMPTSEARHFLGAYLFSGDDVFRPIGTLSGGERGRVALAKLALSGANLLLLDEPTNHLDIESQEILQSVLEDFAGTILLVSHDRYLIDALATQIWAIAGDSVEIFNGNYQEYITARNQRLQQAEATLTASQNNGSNGRSKAANVAEKKHGLNPYELKKQLEKVERQIETLESKIESLHGEIATASTAGNATKVRSLGEEYADVEMQLGDMMTQWEMLME
ncbi:MAG: ATP-binding cassette domain-containing protein, partial [Aggregatilineales bacterium]